jgi:hypothetical protein
MSKLVKKNGKLVKKNGKLVKADSAATCPCCGGDGPCPPGKYCTWIPPDPCSTGKCQPSLISDTPPIQSQCGDAPYDCTSEEACNQWYEQNPNPPCGCWVCEDGEWVNNPSLTCLEDGGFLGPNPPEGEECIPPVKYICATRADACTQFPLNYGQWQYNSSGQWVIRRSRCASQFPADTCTIADAPSRPGTPGEIVNVGCKAVAPSTAKECITEEEFNKGGWTKVSGPHDTLKLCEDACNPPPEPGEACGTMTLTCVSSNPSDPSETGGYWEQSGADTSSCEDCPDGFYVDGDPSEACNSANFGATTSVDFKCNPGRLADNPLP